jgi:hypothetical protein
MEIREELTGIICIYYYLKCNFAPQKNEMMLGVFIPIETYIQFLLMTAINDGLQDHYIQSEVIFNKKFSSFIL